MTNITATAKNAMHNNRFSARRSSLRFWAGNKNKPQFGQQESIWSNTINERAFSQRSGELLQ